MDRTPNHGFHTYEPGDTDWSHSKDMALLEVAVPIRDREEFLGEYEPHDGAKFEATDTGKAFIGDGSGWKRVRSLEDFDAVAAHAVDVSGVDDRTREPGANAKLTGPHPGTVHGEEYRSWAMQRALRAAITPHDRSKARVAFHFDGSNRQDYTDIYPAMRARGLPWTNNLTASRLDASGRITTEEAHEMHAHGMEVGAYVHDEDVRNLQEIEDVDEQVETLLYNRRDLEDLGFNVSTLKGRHDATIGADNLDDPLSYAIRSTFACWTGSNHKPPHRSVAVRPLPDNHLNRGFNMEGATAREMTDHLERVIAVDGVTHYFAHSNYDAFDVEAFATLLDVVDTYRRAGTLDVATVSGMLLMPYDLDAANVAPDPTATGSNQFSVGDYWRYTRGHPSTETGDAYVGDAYYRLRARDRDAFGVFPLGLEPSYSTYAVDLMARSPNGGRLSITQRSQTGKAPYRGNRYAYTVGDEWQRCFASFGLHRTEGRMLVSLAVARGEIHLDNIKIYPT